jgi:predicted MPP superfamily phosphohydrolase
MKRLKLPHWLKRLLLAINLIGYSLIFYGSCIEPFTLRIKEWEVATPKWQGQKELKIALISDMHMIWPWMTAAHMGKIIARINEQHPDIVLLLGDYVGTHPFGVQINATAGLAPLKNISAQCGVFAVLGNHDTISTRINGYPKGWPDALVKTGIPVLQNDAHFLNCNGRKFWIAGLEELWWQNASISKTLKRINNNNPIILMMHQPDSFPNVPRSVALSVAGHTHGGQVRIPFYGPVESVIPSRYGLRYVYGHIREDQKDLVVTSGLGMTGIPIRFLVPPEITIVHLKSAP